MTLQYCTTDLLAAAETYIELATLLPTIYDRWSNNIEKTFTENDEYYLDCQKILAPNFNNAAPFSRSHICHRVKTINANLALIINQIFISAIIERLSSSLKIHPRVPFLINKDIHMVAILNIISPSLQKNIRVSLEKLIHLHGITTIYLKEEIEFNKINTESISKWLAEYKIIERRYKCIFTSYDISFILKETEPDIKILQFFKIGTTARLTHEMGDLHNMLVVTYDIFTELTTINAISIADSYDSLDNLPDYPADELFKWICDLIN